MESTRENGNCVHERGTSAEEKEKENVFLFAKQTNDVSNGFAYSL